MPVTQYKGFNIAPQSRQGATIARFWRNDGRFFAFGGRGCKEAETATRFDPDDAVADARRAIDEAAAKH
jgi:hypothetical protein